MITTPILEEKYRIQRKLAEESGYDVRKYFELSHKIATETEAMHNLVFKYGRVAGGRMEPVVKGREST